MGKAGSSNEKCSGLVLIKNQVVRYGHALSLHTNIFLLFGSRDRQAKGTGWFRLEPLLVNPGNDKAHLGRLLGNFKGRGEGVIASSSLERVSGEQL